MATAVLLRDGSVRFFGACLLLLVGQLPYSDDSFLTHRHHLRATGAETPVYAGAAQVRHAVWDLYTGQPSASQSRRQQRSPLAQAGELLTYSCLSNIRFPRCGPLGLYDIDNASQHTPGSSWFWHQAACSHFLEPQPDTSRTASAVY